MANVRRSDHFVVDGSNIATEGRSQPSLEQLNDAVLSFMEDHPGAVITVVVDATFGHRIADKEVKAFDEAVANNELVTPPAGAIGRGDAFVLTIANKAGAGVLSNDSFQEFHGDYDWLFDEGRLIGGKPVPHVGWVFVARTPVRGPKSRQSVREAKGSAKSTRGASATEAKELANSRVRARSGSQPAADSEENQPAEPASGGRRSGRGRSGRSAGDKQAAAHAPEQTQSPESVRPAPSSRGPVNDLLPFLEFVERHPTGTSCTGVVESYASHGAYARVDDVLIYIPLRLMDSPAPRSARSVLAAGEAVTAVIVGYVADRRSIDAALPHMAAAAVADAGKPADEAGTEPGKRPAKKASASKTSAKKASASKTSAKKASAKQPVADVGGALVSVEPDPAKKPSPKKAAAKKSPADKAPAKRAPAKQAPAKQAAAKQTPAKQAPAKRAPAKRAPAKQAATDKAPAKKAPAEKLPAKASPAKKAPAKKSPGRRAPAKKASS